MTEIQFEAYNEYEEYKRELRKLKTIIDGDFKTQFGGKCLIGDQPNKFRVKLQEKILVELADIKEKQNEI